MSEGERWGTVPPSGLTESRLLLAGWLEDPGQQPFRCWAIADCRIGRDRVSVSIEVFEKRLGNGQPHATGLIEVVGW